jgi:hypothetical protein
VLLSLYQPPLDLRAALAHCPPPLYCPPPPSSSSSSSPPPSSSSASSSASSSSSSSSPSSSSSSSSSSYCPPLTGYDGERGEGAELRWALEVYKAYRCNHWWTFFGLAARLKTGVLTTIANVAVSTDTVTTIGSVSIGRTVGGVHACGVIAVGGGRELPPLPDDGWSDGGEEAAETSEDIAEPIGGSEVILIKEGVTTRPSVPREKGSERVDTHLDDTHEPFCFLAACLLSRPLFKVLIALTPY